MKLLVVLIIALAAFLAVAERPSVPLAQTDWSAVSPAAEITTVATKKDLLVYADASAGSSPSNGKRNAFGTAPAPAGGPVMSVRRRNADGVYVLVGNFTEAASQYATTNGKWVAMYFGNIGFFSVDANNQMSNLSVISNSGVQSGFLLSDDTFVAYDSVSPLDDGNYTIRTFEYEASNNTWQEIAGIGLVVTYGVASQSGVSTYVVTDTHLVALDPSNSSRFVINIYERQADKSWKFVEAVPVNNTLGYINYNSVDTLTMWLPVPDESGSAYGVLFVYTKVNGKWIDQRFSTTSVGFSPVGYFGIITAFLDANNMLASAPFEGYSGSGNPTNAGKVLLMTRNDGGLWEPAADLTGSGLFGTGIGFNDYDVVIPSFDLSSSSVLSFYTAPICFYEPINVTCSNQQVSDCSQVDITSLYTVNNPQCGAVKATLGGFGLVDNKALEAQFSFTKGFGASYSCNATVTCPVPPIAVQQTPSKVSSSVGVQFGLVSIFGLVAVLFL